ncbi:MAG: hypothetical protein JRN67_10630 [Nitrososphaerota archaeon]|nr:hypothetical protein [Nitrososphaerota archaeon]
MTGPFGTRRSRIEAWDFLFRLINNRKRPESYFKDDVGGSYQSHSDLAEPFNSVGSVRAMLTLAKSTLNRNLARAQRELIIIRDFSHDTV